MVFTSLHYVAFLAVVYPLYRALGHRAQNAMLLLASYYFYGSWDWRFLSLLLGSTIVDFLVGRYLGRTDVAPGRRRLALILSLVFNFGMLGFFKYFNFFVENVAGVLASAGISVNEPTLRILLPVGISFYTFQAMSYTIEVYRGAQPPEKHFGRYSLYVMYFPQLVAGPIERPQNLLHQFHEEQHFDAARVRDGLSLALFGLFKKVVVADAIRVR